MGRRPAAWSQRLANPAFIYILQAARGQQLHRPLAAEVHRGPRVKPSLLPSGTPSPAADRTSLHDVAPPFYTAAIINHQLSQNYIMTFESSQTVD